MKSDRLASALEFDAARVREEYARRETDPQVRRYYARIGPALARAHAVRRERMLRMSDPLGPRDSLRLLDVGCGSGEDLSFFHRNGFAAGRLAGVDLREEDVIQARIRIPGATCLVANAAKLPFGDRAFDVTVQTTALSSIVDPDVRALVSAEMTRVTRPDGLIVSWDLRRTGSRNPHLVSIDDEEIRRLFGGVGQLQTFRATLNVGLASRVGPRAASVLAHLPPLLDHLVLVVRPSGARS
jgi:ubiquinone/menaquinone biosynthesis C-methylase UbiE